MDRTLLLLACAPVGAAFSGAAARRALRAAPPLAAHVDLADPATLATFFLWGSPVPLGLTALIRGVEDLEAERSGEAAASGADALGSAFNICANPGSMGYAFPSFGLAMRAPTEPAFFGAPAAPLDRAVRGFLALNVYAGIGWYLYYKYQVEDELRRRSGEGLGGAAIVLPFAAGLILGVGGQVAYGSLETLDFFSGAFWLAFVWIYVNQWVLYEKVNSLYVDAGKPKPLSTWGLLVPGYNFITGIRQIHFLSALWCEERGETPRPDPFCALFPFATKPELGIVELFTQPDLWVSASGREVLGRWWRGASQSVRSLLRE